MQASLGVTPDLVNFGKEIGGSGPHLVVAGKVEIIDLADPARKGHPDYTYLNGTLHGNPVAATATLATLDELTKPGTYARLNAATDDFRAEAQTALVRHFVSAIAANVGSLWQFLFMARPPPRSQADMMAADHGAMRRLDTGMMKRGHYMLPGVRRFMSCVHSEAEIFATLAALDAVCGSIAL